MEISIVWFSKFCIHIKSISQIEVGLAKLAFYFYNHNKKRSYFFLHRETNIFITFSSGRPTLFSNLQKCCTRSKRLHCCSEKCSFMRKMCVFGGCLVNILFKAMSFDCYPLSSQGWVWSSLQEFHSYFIKIAAAGVKWCVVTVSIVLMLMGATPLFWNCWHWNVSSNTWEKTQLRNRKSHSTASALKKKHMSNNFKFQVFNKFLSLMHILIKVP